MTYQINESEFKTTLETVGQIGNNVGHEVVSQYQEETDEYDVTSFRTRRIWEDFLSYELHHLLARLGFQKMLEKEYNISSRVRGIDERIDWTSFHNPWNQRLTIKTNSLENRLSIRGLQPHYNWVTLTERQYNRLPSDTLVSAAKVSFRDWGNHADLIQPGPTRITHIVGDKEIQEDPDYLGEIRRKFDKFEDMGKFVVYKFNKEIDWMAEFNSPIEIDILGVSDIDKFNKSARNSPDKFSADYFLHTSDLTKVSENID
ncbi:hypothetical protein [Halorubrum kocurii]|uniref:hypothetical protein n=1 Tax=Halorubrum kocurii TaxID=478441 RepID=UPI001268E2F0|nr:hypothetical protein [Halorubrum kocurii]